MNTELSTFTRQLDYQKKNIQTLTTTYHYQQNNFNNMHKQFKPLMDYQVKLHSFSIQKNIEWIIEYFNSHMNKINQSNKVENKLEEKKPCFQQLLKYMI